MLIIYTTILLKNLSDTIKILQKILKQNESNIDSILKESPSIAKNIEIISSDVSHDVQSLQKTFDKITGSTKVVTSSLSKNSNFLTWIISTIQIIYSAKEFIHTFSTQKRKK
jgi:uncharacterized protein YoxC